MIKIDVDVDSGLLQELVYRLPAIFGEKVAPATQAAFQESARYVQSMWKGWAMGSPINGVQDIKKPNSKLAASIKIRKHGVFDAEIYTESPYMQRIQEGTPRLDMKETYPYGRKSRVSKIRKTKEGEKGGVPYLIIPFRWGTPNQEGKGRAHFANFIETEAFKTIRKMKTSKRLAEVDKKTGEITGGITHMEKNYSGEDIERSDYEWGSRHDTGNTEDHESGMVRMSGGGGYWTFRIISRDSPANKWWKKAVPAVDVVGALESEVRPKIEDAIQAGLEADLDI